jgi:hypothetical protein
VTERYALYFRLGVEVLTGADNWEASLADSKMPHEKLPNPDWTRGSDKSAAEWQTEAGIAELPEEEKETAIVRRIAAAGGFPSPPAEIPPQRNGQGNGGSTENGNQNGSGYKRWKPGNP